MRPYEGGLILLVEDNDLVRWATEEGLQEAGWSIHSVSTGDAAITEVEQDVGRFVALLTDIEMPGRANGWDVAFQCRKLAPGMPVVYMTGNPWHTESSKAVAGSILLQKPFTDQQLYAALHRLLGGAQ